jgi:uncharacterized protein YqjF (DUF2071 family)
MTHVWEKLAFCHYAIDPESLRPHLPPGLEPDVFPDEAGEPKAWIGFVPFDIPYLRIPGYPKPFRFLETNVRTYVRHADIPGVWFFSLDAESRQAVWAARRTFGLPYWHSRMSARGEVPQLTYEGSRITNPDAKYRLELSVLEEIGEAQPGTREFFFVERYLLYSYYLGRLWSGRVHHAPYRLHKAKADSLDESLTTTLNLPKTTYSDFLWSSGVTVEVFRIQRV